MSTKQEIDYDRLVEELQEADLHRAAAYAIQVLRAEIVRLEAEKPRHDAALRTLIQMGYYWNGGAYYKKPVPLEDTNCKVDSSNN